jgi:hypothetical protein
MEAENMNTYEKPEIEVIKFEVPEVITVSSEQVEHDNSYGDIADFLKRKY